MAYAKVSTGPSGEVQRLQEEITREVNTDAQHLATAVFGKPGNMPDMQRLDDDVIDARYKAAYQSGDRKWLVGEAQRDPEQFVKVARRIGVMLPEEVPPGPPALPQPAAMPVPPAPTQPMMMPPPAPFASSLPPVAPGVPPGMPGPVAPPGPPVMPTVPGLV